MTMWLIAGSVMIFAFYIYTSLRLREENVFIFKEHYILIRVIDYIIKSSVKQYTSKLRAHFRSGSHSMYAHMFRLYLLGTGLVVGLYIYRTSYKQTLITTHCVPVCCCNGGNYVSPKLFFSVDSIYHVP